MRYFSGIEHRPVGEKDKKTLTTSDAYLEAFGELFPQGRIDLLDHPVLIRELRGLEMRP